MTFSELGVSQAVVNGLSRHGITQPTNIQQKAIPPAIAGKDLIGISRTGSGKTISFSIPVLERIKVGAGLQALILAPTRELAVQISNEINAVGRELRPSVATVYGGVGLDPQIRAIAKADIVVGTPGRIIDHLGRGNLDLSRLIIFVLDEADKMVEMGFIEDVEQVLDAAPKDRQILLFGATISNEIEHLRDSQMKSPVVAEAETQVKKDLLEQYYYNVQRHQKFSLLVHLLQSEREHATKTIIFCSARRTVDVVADNLKAQGIKVFRLHGKIGQHRRLRILEQFHKAHKAILIASAVAARGLDIREVTHVINYDLSNDPQEYIHRVGRTARAGESGKALTLLCERDYDAFSAILHRYKIEVTELPLPEFKRLRFNASAGRDDRSGGRGGHGRRRPMPRRGENHPRSHRSSGGFGGSRGSSSNNRGGNRNRNRSSGNKPTTWNF